MLIEVLVALSVTAILLASIGSLVATAVRGTRSLELGMAQLEVARALAAELLQQGPGALGTVAGTSDGHSWQIDAQPLGSAAIDLPPSASWVPFVVTIKVKSSSGRIAELQTVRLRRRDGR